MDEIGAMNSPCLAPSTFLENPTFRLGFSVESGEVLMKLNLSFSTAPKDDLSLRWEGA